MAAAHLLHFTPIGIAYLPNPGPCRGSLMSGRCIISSKETVLMRIAQIAPLTEAIPPKLYGGTERVVSWLTE